MSDNTQQDVNAKTLLLKKAYAQELPAKLQIIRDYCSQILGLEKQKLREFHIMIHSLAGSAKIFGFLELCNSARRMEYLLAPFIQTDKILDKTLKTQLENLAQKMQSIPHSQNNNPDQDSLIAKPQDPEKPHAGLIYLLTSPMPPDPEFVRQLNFFDLHVQTFSTLEDLNRHQPEQPPRAIIIDTETIQASSTDAPLAASIRENQNHNSPIFIISAQDNFEQRLIAARQGSDGFFTKPCNINQLLNRLNRIEQKSDAEPYRILLIDDDPILGPHYTLNLTQAGFNTTFLNNPRNILNSIIETRPELIIMNLYTPDCSGFELANIIRQEDNFLHIPIVFLCSETNPQKQQLAMQTDGDDFLTKPITDDHLIKSIRTRVTRTRMLNSLMNQDSLTGLLNHTIIKERLETEVARARRNHTRLAYAILDIDHFKTINDNHGHSTGDRVIKTLAQMLQQKLRKSDEIGRYGGAEFCIILPDCDTTSAFKVIDRIRQNFANLIIHYNDNKINVSLSAAIACHPGHGNAEQIHLAADKALYQAKANGRNQVIIAQLP